MADSTASYGGPERRRHRMYVTRNSEYHCRDQLCVAVRDRETGAWLSRHSALNRGVSGSVRFSARGEAYPSAGHPRVGDALFFAADGPDVVTSCLTAIERPAKSVVASYPS